MEHESFPMGDERLGRLIRAVRSGLLRWSDVESYEGFDPQWRLVEVEDGIELNLGVLVGVVFEPLRLECVRVSVRKIPFL